MDQMRELNALTEKVIGLAIDVHRALGPGLLESAYRKCLCYE
ncbi:MAG TPA: GxxExxY protein, partial [bacterium]